VKKLFSAPRLLALVAITALAALALASAGGVAAQPGKGKGHAKAKGHAKIKAHAKNCKTIKVGFVVSGTYVSHTSDTVTLTVTNANRHARHSGEMAGATFTVAAGDAFILTLEGYEGADTPSAGDFVHVVGKIEVEKKKCADDGTSTADRYGELDVRKVVISDRDADV
jgi:hypothetical protein